MTIPRAKKKKQVRMKVIFQAGREGSDLDILSGGLLRG